MLYRSLELSASPEGRTIVAPCIVPYNRVARVCDQGGLPYDECFAPGVFKRNLKAPHHVLVRAQHGNAFLDICGRAITLQETEQGMSGEFTALRSAPGEQALAMIREGIYQGFSVGFVPIKSRVGEQGEIIRVAGHLDHVALVMEPAYADSAALAIRQASVKVIDELRPIIDEALENRLTALGLTRA